MQKLISNCAFYLVLCLFLSGCSSHYGAAYITSIPAGAEVVSVDDGTTLGVTPTTVWWKDKLEDRQHVAVRFKKDGYYDKVSSFWLSMRHSSAKNAKKDPTLLEVSLQKKDR